MKTLITIMFLISYTLCYCQVYQFDNNSLYSNTISPGELIIYNNTVYAETHFSGDSSYPIMVRVYPISAMFNNARNYTLSGHLKFVSFHLLFSFQFVEVTS